MWMQYAFWRTTLQQLQLQWNICCGNNRVISKFNSHSQEVWTGLHYSFMQNQKSTLIKRLQFKCFTFCLGQNYNFVCTTYSQIKNRQMHDKVRALESSMAREKDLRLDLEAEIIEKNSAIDERGKWKTKFLIFKACQISYFFFLSKRIQVFGEGLTSHKTNWG